MILAIVFGFLCFLRETTLDLFAPIFRTGKHLSTRLFCTTMLNKDFNLFSSIQTSLHHINSLMLSCDVHTNSGPSIFYYILCAKVTQRPQNSKFFHLNAHIIENKLLAVTFSVINVGMKTLFGFSET